jgi:hypothetical protein
LARVLGTHNEERTASSISGFDKNGFFYMQKNETGPISHTVRENQFQTDKRLKSKPLKLLEENIRGTSMTLSWVTVSWTGCQRRRHQTQETNRIASKQVMRTRGLTQVGPDRNPASSLTCDALPACISIYLVLKAKL